ncbi:MAG: hypothetical protein QM780_05025 [Hyphomicrobium sp.]|uniref:hypothetical protein n=1 Tax=Hyphomicrobium sp. TaxID=82 RepID=UPI0039E71F67
MSLLGWMNRRQPQQADPQQNPKPVNKRPKVDAQTAKERAQKNSPWRFDDGPSRRPVGSK